MGIYPCRGVLPRVGYAESAHLLHHVATDCICTPHGSLPVTATILAFIAFGGGGGVKEHGHSHFMSKLGIARDVVFNLCVMQCRPECRLQIIQDDRQHPLTSGLETCGTPLPARCGMVCLIGGQAALTSHVVQRDTSGPPHRFQRGRIAAL